ncbi:MAG TPA: hypothetical protein ENK44_05840 [Caldithrix abyssi]|uniref:Uncharacterized protein n=1 Tax=Caldithrix abyssi TaxID=187145 RepID=A0A7V4U0U7_CALAY|nr:hypothetical protein [Caldithrix abyssi]
MIYKKIVLFFSIIILLNYTYAEKNTLSFYLTPKLSISNYKMNFSGIYTWDLPKLSQQNFMATSNFKPYFQPSLDLRVTYKNFEAGFDFYMENPFEIHIFSAETEQFDGNGKTRYYLTQGDSVKYLQTDDPVKSGLRTHNGSLYLNYNISNYFKINLSYKFYTLEYYKISPPAGIRIDSLGYSMSHTQKITLVNFGFEYNYYWNDWNFGFEGEYAPFLNMTIKDIYNKNHYYNGYAYFLGTKIGWKQFLVRYTYNHITTNDNSFSNIYHRFEIGFIWKAFKLDLTEIDIFH